MTNYTLPIILFKKIIYLKIYKIKTDQKRNIHKLILLINLNFDFDLK